MSVRKYNFLYLGYLPSLMDNVELSARIHQTAGSSTYFISIVSKIVNILGIFQILLLVSNRLQSESPVLLLVQKVSLVEIPRLTFNIKYCLHCTQNTTPQATYFSTHKYLQLAPFTCICNDVTLSVSLIIQQYLVYKAV